MLAGFFGLIDRERVAGKNDKQQEIRRVLGLN